MEPVTMIGLHGFLGLPSDWDAVKDRCGSRWQLRAPFLFSESGQRPGEGPPVWAERFTAGLVDTRRSVLLGYSLGARLGLHALLASRSSWSAAVLVGGHPG